MTELSFPFDADNASGGSKVVSQTQWQQMALAWGGDRVDFALTNSTYLNSTLPFATTLSGRNVTMAAGAAWVGGFYYKLSGSKTLTIAANGTSKARKDLIVLRADMAKAAVTMEILQGTEATTPVGPPLTRAPGGVWEMALHEVDVPANNGSITTVIRKAPFPVPGTVAFPWNAAVSAPLLPRGSFSVDMDNNGGGVQQEAFNGRDGYVLTRDLGKSLTYVPNTLFVSGSVPEGNRRGRWRWVAPNLFWFSVTIVNDYEDQGLVVSGSNYRVAVTLPVNVNSKPTQTLAGFLNNPYGSGGLPPLQSVTAFASPGTNVLNLYVQNPNSLAAGIYGLKQFPARSSFSISGVLEANVFSE
ncbi:hypothetical protein ACIBAH_34865 [Streptomyces sp. NPDC051445]|uniref:hypothetical protein n=1 Tax=Streptomyces sp. NPDC051445 TaxID=3365653 RepID=UPI0037971BB7